MKLTIVAMLLYIILFPKIAALSGRKRYYEYTAIKAKVHSRISECYYVKNREHYARTQYKRSWSSFKYPE
jgi:hypothetical protein